MINAILTDIEGTTSSINFVNDVLFPYAEKAMPEYIEAHKDDPAVAALIDQVLELSDGDSSEENTAKSSKNSANVRQFSENELDSAISTLVGWIKTQTKVEPLKVLQAQVWTSGYKNGDFTAHLYDDALNVLSEWHNQNIPIFTFSSATIKAQQLFFGYSGAGDIRYLFSDYFDATQDAKRNSTAYQVITENIAIDASETLFISDSLAELDAAKEAGFQTCLISRSDSEQNTSSNSHHPCVQSFNEIDLAAF